MYDLILNSKGNLTAKFAKVFARFAKFKENGHRLKDSHRLEKIILILLICGKKLCVNLTAKYARFYTKFAK